MHHLTLAAPPADLQGIQPAPLRYFSGELIAKDAGCTLGLHALALRLEDEDGCNHVVFIHHGRGAAAGDRCLAQYEGMQIGRRYHGSATLHRIGEQHHWWMGAVTLKPCQRRPRFELIVRAQA